MLKHIAEIVNESITIGLTIDIKDGEITMLVKISPKTDDAALTGLPPVIISGTPEECEQDLVKFFNSPALEQIASTASGVLEFEQAAQKASEESKIAKQIKEKIEKLLKKGEGHLEKKEFVSADKVKAELIEALGKSSNKKVSKFITDLATAKASDGQVDLLSAIAEEVDPDVQVRGKDSRAVEYGIEEERIEIIQQDAFNKLDQDGNTTAAEDF